MFSRPQTLRTYKHNMSHWKIYTDVNLYFVTTTIVQWQDVFASIPLFETIIESLKYCITHKGLHLHGYVIMPNHAHYILSAEPAERLSNNMRDFNRYTSQRITTLLEEIQRADILDVFSEAASAERWGNRYKVWRDGFHPIAIGTADFLEDKLNYSSQKRICRTTGTLEIFQRKELLIKRSFDYQC